MMGACPFGLSISDQSPNQRMVDVLLASYWYMEPM